METHTPGPWVAEGLNIRTPKSLYLVANGEENYNELCANAELIATAPELLEALKALRSAINDNIESDGDDGERSIVPLQYIVEELEHATQVIAKAEGRS